MSFSPHQARERSAELAEARGVFPTFKGSIYDRSGGMRLRNATVTSITPTGTLSLLADCSSGVEPLFGIRYTRRSLEDMDFQLFDPLFAEMGEKERILTEELVEALAEGKGLQDLPQVPKEMKDLFITTFEIPPIGHIRIQAAFQAYTDNAVSKTINFSRDATKDEVGEAFLAAYRERCKGITIYRDGSKAGQVLACGTKQAC